jgi:hypothetical protein
MKTLRVVPAAVVAASFLAGGVLASLAPGCGRAAPSGFQSPEAGTDTGSSGSSSGGLSLDSDAAPPSVSSVSCPDGGTTTISGTVYDPAKKNPLYNVVVYVPGSTPAPLKTGASCDSCNSLYTGNPIATSLTDTSGKFTITNAPVGTKVPLVIQIGKWRKQLQIPTVTACTDNPQPDKSLSLPTMGSEGDIPNIAVSTGGADSLECLFLRVGLDPSEYTGGVTGTGHIHIYEGTAATAGAVPSMTPGASSSSSLWAQTADLMKYDIVLLSCEGEETQGMNQSALQAYTTAGGRVFASHYHYAWFNTGPFAADNLATWTPGGNSIASLTITSLLDVDAVIDQTLPDGGPFVKGQALDRWLGVVGALETSGQVGDLEIAQAKHNADVGPANVYSQSWIHADTDSTSPGATQYFSFNTPVNAPLDDAGLPAYCGRVVYSDLHVGAVNINVPADYGGIGYGGTVPTGCVSRDLSPQEKALEFMLFDLSSCVVPDDQAPPAPPPVDPPK